MSRTLDITDKVKLQSNGFEHGGLQKCVLELPQSSRSKKHISTREQI
jgi:hypothetical protein